MPKKCNPEISETNLEQIKPKSICMARQRYVRGFASKNVLNEKKKKIVG